MTGHPHTGSRVGKSLPAYGEKFPDDRPCVVMLWYELTPYHAHALKRINSEISDVRWVHVFTHSISRSSMPWDMRVPDGVELHFDELNKIPNETFIHRRFPGMFRFLRGLIRENRPTLVLTAGHEDISRWLLIPYLKWLRVPYVLWSDSNVYGLTRGRPLKDAARRAYLRTIVRGFDACMPMGTCGRAYYAMLGVRHKPMFTWPYEPDYSLIEQRDPEAETSLSRRIGLKAGRRRFLYSGRLIAVKRVDLLILAFASIADQLPEWDLVIAGGGPLEQQLRESVPEHLRHRVIFTGFMQMHDVRCCYHLSDVLVHPSQFEPWALVINEAVAAGMAVIATYVTGAAVELVRHNVNGMLVAPGSRRELEAAMLRCADEPTLSAFRGAARAILDEWRRAGDPIRGLRGVVQHFDARPGP
jgi:glycosyltransferase involved in cell wall biosynthesis